jgi:hypothetical protein
VHSWPPKLFLGSKKVHQKPIQDVIKQTVAVPAIETFPEREIASAAETDPAPETVSSPEPEQVSEIVPSPKADGLPAAAEKPALNCVS